MSRLNFSVNRDWVEYPGKGQTAKKEVLIEIQEAQGSQTNGRGNKNIDKIQKYRQISIFEPLSSISLLMVEGQVGNLGKKVCFFFVMN